MTVLGRGCCGVLKPFICYAECIEAALLGVIASTVLHALAALQHLTHLLSQTLARFCTMLDRDVHSIG
jgi:hypothetical protein